MTKPRNRWITLVSMCSALLTGCQPVKPVPRHAGQSGPIPGSTSESLDEALNSDPCSTRMQDIGHVVASYCFNHHGQLPATLDELKAVPGLGADLNLKCPMTGQLYQYSQGGLFLPNQTMRIVLWEPTASHGGSRLCVLIPPTDPLTPVVTYVKPIPERDFQKALAPIQ